MFRRSDPLESLKGDFREHLTQLTRRDCHLRQRHPCEGCLGNVVVADDRDILRHPNSPLQQPMHDAHRLAVRCHE